MDEVERRELVVMARGHEWNELVRYGIFRHCTQGYVRQYFDTSESSRSGIGS